MITCWTDQAERQYLAFTTAEQPATAVKPLFMGEDAAVTKLQDCGVVTGSILLLQIVEEDMLELAFEPRPSSRLGCQVRAPRQMLMQMQLATVKALRST